MIDVYNFCLLQCEDMEDLTIWDISSDCENEVFKGTYLKAMYSKYSNYEVQSFNIDDGVLCINIDTKED